MSSVPPPPPVPSDDETPGPAPAAPPAPAPSVPPVPSAPPAPVPPVASAPPAPTPTAPPVPSPLPAGPPAPPAPAPDSTFASPAPAGPPPSVPLNTYGPPTGATPAVAPQGHPYGPGPDHAAGLGYAPPTGYVQGVGYAPAAGYPQGPGYVPAPGQPGVMPSWGAPPTPKKTSRAVLFSVLGVVVLALLAVGAYLVFFAGDSAEPLEADVDASVEADAQQVVVGNCIETLPGDGEVETVTVVPCDEDHEAQVISAKKFSQGADFPGADDARTQTVEKCTVDAIDDVDVDLTAVELRVWAPTEESWDQGDRQGLCIASVPGSLDRSLLD